MTIKKLLIANRGEIAVRIIRAARELGIITVQAHSDADENSMAVRMANEAVNIGPSPATKSYLNANAIIEAAVRTGADAIHPGYGFFSENPDFVDSVEAAGLTFVGPDGDTMRLMGDKVSARQTAANAGVPTVPGSPGRLENMDDVQAIAEEIGFPVMIKAAAGGGGRGIRIVDTVQDLKVQASQASTEAKAAFGDGGLYLEKVIEHARHIEVQILGDGENVIHCFERECSLQRRRQKVWEEAPAAILSENLRNRLCSTAVDLAISVNYRGAGTVEFLFDEQTEEFYFIEMNTRIQVEHPVSELITGVDLVKEMLLIAGGGKLRFTQKDIYARGHAIEVRINAEDPAQGFMPFPGLIDGLTLPNGPGVRFDGMIYSGYEVPPFYDSLLGKLIVWETDRDSAIIRLDRALAEFEISGIKTTIPLFQALAKNDAVRQGQIDTKWLERWLESNANTII